MIIHSPVVTEDSGDVVVSAAIEFETTVPDMPESLWFKFPESQREHISRRADGFLVTMILLAMQYGEDIEVKGEVSPKLLLGLDEYQRVLNMWFPYRFNIIQISSDNITVPQAAQNGDVICAFSGGVDSFFTLWSHLPANDKNPASSITHSLFVHGFDLKLEDEDYFHRLKSDYSDMFKNLDIVLLTGSTNYQSFGTRWDWGIYHGTALIGTAHVLGHKAAKFYVPASHTYRDLMPWGSDPRIDHLLSTETVEVVHDGAGYKRTEKTAAISAWPVTYEHLRVCTKVGKMVNCSRCEKCLRTMVTLDMMGALQNYTTFEKPVRTNLLSKCIYRNASDFAFAMEILDYSLELKRMDIVLNISCAILVSRILQTARFVKVRLIRLKRLLFQ